MESEDLLPSLLDQTPYSLSRSTKNRHLVDGLNVLTRHHQENCSEYARILDGIWGGAQRYEHVHDIPYLPVSLFKKQKLMSVDEKDLRLTLTSSGTTGQTVSQIFVDAQTSTRQQKALAHSLGHVIGRKRLPMLVIDTDAVFKDPKKMSARGAGVLGIMRFGRNHAFALNPDLSPNVEAVEAFLRSIDGQPFVMFGFTYMVWLSLYEKFRGLDIDLSNGILIHSGGWKKLVEKSVEPEVFRSSLKNAFNLTKVYNFYGMVEQIGSIFLEGPGGHLYPPNFSDVIVRNPETWEPCEPGVDGIIQVVSLIPLSYPGHSLLTEDWGRIEVVDPGEDGWMGKGLRILGRIPKTELRGCSDVIGEQLS